MLIPFQEADDYIQGMTHCGYGIFSNIGAGFQIGMPTGFIDLVAEVPFLSIVFIKSSLQLHPLLAINTFSSKP